MICGGKRTPGANSLGLLLLLCAGLGGATEPVVVATWGGAYETAQRAALFEPFSEATGIPVKTLAYDGNLATLAADSARWTVMDMSLANVLIACETGLLQPFDPSILEPASDGTPAHEDFLPGSIQPCGVSHLLYATVLVYDERAFPGEKPRQVADFFDLENFPGPRALRRAPVGLLEWALLSYGVPRRQLYDLLSTERGLKLAFGRLDDIRPVLHWWQSGQEPIDLLLAGELSMASAYNGRVFAAQNAGAPLTIIWDGQLLDANVWAIPTGANRTLAKRFIAFATRAERLAALSNRISYGPARRSAQWRIGRHVETGVPMATQLPTAPQHLERAVVQDHLWYSHTQPLREVWFEAWLGE